MHYFTLLASLLPLALASPLKLAVRDNSETCTSRSSGISEWELTEFDYHASYTFSTPAHQNSWGYISFTVHNPMLDTSTNCSAASNQLSDFFYGTMEYECDASTEGQDLAGTKFTFSRPSGNVTLEQSWYCYDDPQFPATFTAKGDAVADLDCKETFWQNSNWTIGQIYSQRNIDCEHISLPVPVKEISAIA